MSRPLYAEHEWVTGGKCPSCGADCGTIWKQEETDLYWFPSGYSTYRVEAGGRMGNKSYRDNDRVGRFCACGWADTK